MDKLIVVVDNIKDWKPYFPSDQVIAVNDYLFDRTLQEKKNLKVINLCNKMSYLKSGYYCSMLAEARNHKVIPNLKTLNDLSKKKYYLHDLKDFNDSLDDFSLHHRDKILESEISFRVFFSKVSNKLFEPIARKVFDYYPAPILEVVLKKIEEHWHFSSVEQLGIGDLEETEEEFFANSLENYSLKMWRLPKNRKHYIYDLAILIDPDEEQAPSDDGALKKFKKACERAGVWCEHISTKDASRLSEFDALFIRKTTSIQNSTYRLAKIAETEGIVVIDDPSSILKCTNKIFISNLLERIGVQSIPGRYVSDAKSETVEDLIERFSLPLVVKIPDGSFSVGVKKATTKEEVKAIISEFLKKSDLVLVQKFLYTDFDWRVGILGNEAIFACQYFMSKGHWQIYNHEKDKSTEEFSGNFKTYPVDKAPSQIIKTALKATKPIGRGLYGVDLKQDINGNVYVVEINDNPNIDDGIEDQVLGDTLYDKLVTWFVEEIKKKKASL